MKLQGRELRIESHGDDVRLLHRELAAIGLEIPDPEAKEGVFGKNTLRAIRRFQDASGLPVTGLVDEATAKAINARFDEGHADKPDHGDDTAAHDDEPAHDDARAGGKDDTGDVDKNPDDGAKGGDGGDGGNHDDGSHDDGEPEHGDGQYEFVVHGHVRTPAGRPVANARITAFDRNLRASEPLGVDRTRDDGSYSISYSSDKFARAQKESADLLVRCEVPDAKERVESPILFNAPRDATIDLVAAAGAEPSEFERIRDILTPLRGDVPFADLVEDAEHDDVSFLAGETGIDHVRIAFMIVAHRHQARTKIDAAAFYGLFREGLPTALGLLSKQPVIELAAAIRSAATNGTIPASLAERAEATAADLVANDLGEAVDPGQDGPIGSFGALLAVGLEAPEERTRFLQLYLAHDGTTESFWRGLRDDKSFDRAVIDRLQRTLQLGTLTQNHAPLVAHLSELLDAGDLGSLRDLASFDEARWTSLVEQAGGVPDSVAGTDEPERMTRYVRTISHMIEDAYPAAVIAHRGSDDPALAANAAVRFLADHADFDLRTSNADAVVQAAKLDGEEARVVRDDLKTIQRVFKVAPRYEALRALVGEGIHSAYAITRMSRNAFVERFGPEFGATQAAIVYENASQTHAFAVNLIGEYAPGLNSISLRSLESPLRRATGSGLEIVGIAHDAVGDPGHGGPQAPPLDSPGPVSLPDWETLFGSLDFCECEHCRSVYSPAAYLVDLLHFLKDRPAKAAGVSTKAVLLGRRPDLAEIELTCDNTNLVLPYVDLVNEILENDIAPFVPFALPAATAADLDGGGASGAILSEFVAANHDLANVAEVDVLVAGSQWAITDHTQRYRIDAAGGAAPSVVGISYQTSGTPAELVANPQHVNPAAYDTLRQAVFPWTLPFDLWLEEARAYLGHLGVPRNQLMKAFRQAGDLPTDLEIAAEELGLTANERRLYAAQPLVPARTAPEFFGFAAGAGPNWVADAGQLRTFMKVTDLSADDVTELLRMRFVNPTGVVAVESTDPADPFTCDTAKLAVQHHDAPTLDRIHRFLRLQRRLGWTMRELDRALSVLSPAAIDGTTIQAVAGVRRLSTALNLPVRDVLCFYGLLDTHDYAAPSDDDRPTYAELFLNPAVIKLNPGEPGPFALTADRSELAVIGALTDRPVAAVLLGALSISEDELGSLVSGPHPVVTPGKELNRANLSRLTRSVLLARGLGIGAGELTALVSIRGVAPFVAADADLFAGGPATPQAVAKTEEMIRLATRLAAYSLTVPDLVAIIAGRADPASSATPTDATIAATLVDLRAGLRTIVDSTSSVIDEKGDLTRKQLAQLKWDVPLLDEAMGALLGTTTFEAPLNALPAGVTFEDIGSGTAFDPITQRLRFRGRMSAVQQTMLLALSADAAWVASVNALTAATAAADEETWTETPLAALPPSVTFDPIGSRAAYDEETKRLRFAGPMSANQRLMLGSLAGAATYQTALDRLLAAPRAVVTGKMASFKLPTFDAALAALPAEVVFTRPLKSKIFFDVGVGRLKFTGYMSPAEQTALKALSTDAAYLAAVDALFAAQTGFVPDPAQAFLTAADAGLIFDRLQPVPARLKVVLQKLQPYLRRTLSEALAKQKLGEAVGLEAAAGEALLGSWLRSPAHPPALALADALAPAFAGSDPEVKVTRTAFPDQFAAVSKLSSVAALMSRLQITAAQLEWVFADAATAGWLDLNALPAAPTVDPSPLFAAFERLLALAELRDSIRGGASVLSEVFGLARAGTAVPLILETLATRTGWNADDLTSLAAAPQFNLAAAVDFGDERGLARLSRAFQMLRRLGVSAERAVAWTKPEPTEQDARGIRQAVKAKYEVDDWLALAGPLRDTLRELQRSALVAYLVVRPDAARQQNWSDPDGIYQHFLIDVEMSPCQLTSRIKQAISSVQQFVQRCLLNLESQVAANTATDSHWREWPWMKLYRVWEANRKVFLYPENWVEPELRLDKSPFFKELEADLLQQEVTAESAEDAFLSYLEKLDEVAHLEVQGVYHLVEKDQAGNTAVDEYHAFGRTRGTPHAYFHRVRVDGLFWTAWERLDLDIEGDNLIPVVWNRRLYLFWTVFTIQSEEGGITMPAPGGNVREPEKYWTVQLAWSQYRHGKWQAKKTSRELVETWNTMSVLRPDDYTFKARIDQQTGDLLILCLEDAQGSGAVGGFRLSGSNGAIQAYDMKDPKKGVYYVLPPDRMQLLNMGFIEQDPDSGPLYLTTGTPAPGASYMDLGDQTSQATVLRQTPGYNRYRVLPPHQYEQFTSQDAFFFEDGFRTFFVEPHAVETRYFSIPDRAEPNFDPRIHDYYEIDPWWSDPIGPIEQPGNVDPVYDPLFQLVNEPGFAERLSASDALGPTGPLKFQGTGLSAKAILAGPASKTGSLIARRAASAVRDAGGSFVTRGLTEIENFDMLSAPGSTPLSFLGANAAPGAVAFTSSPASAKMIAASETAYGPGFVDYASLIISDSDRLGVNTPIWGWLRSTHYLFSPFYHPYVGMFIKELNRNGLDALFQRTVQTAPQSLVDPVPPASGPPSAYDFWTTYLPTNLVDTPYPSDSVDFDEVGGYSIYNWELFVHVPLLIASRLSQNQRHEEALRFYHVMYDPTDTSAFPSPKRYWKTRPFHERADASYQVERIENLLDLLAHGSSDPKLQAQVAQWRKHPFEPHIVARLRTTAYQKSIVMKYFDNLIAWGDMLFRRDTIESINEAALLYVMVAENLGAVPVRMATRGRPVIHTYRELEPTLDAFSNALVSAEDFAPAGGGTVAGSGTSATPGMSLPALLYFCIPPNDRLLGYWDTVSDRLFKIRNCQNIEGVTRQLALFEPPIDPGVLVRAVAAGLDLGAVLNDMSAPLPPYRFATMVGKANDLTTEVKALGGALLTAIEKRDAEALALLRSTHEIKVLKAARQVRSQQIDEAKRGLEGIQKQRELAEIRRQYYSSREFMNSGETAHLGLMSAALGLQTAASVLDTTASIVHLIPNVKVGAPTSMGLTFGGENVGDALKGFAGSLGLIANTLNASGTMASTLAGYNRRADDWALQTDLAAKEIEQLEKQIAGAEVRVAVAEKELANHDIQIENARDADAFMRDKFSNRELYDWMIGQISSTYFQSYQLAYDVAKRAEQSYRHELGLGDSSFIEFGYWDSLRKGLLAGERLSHDIKRLDISYHEENRREYELSKRVSLAMLDPRALYALKKTGECFVTLPEAIWDLDTPGHYMRRLKTVAVSVPSVTGPYTSVNLTLTLLRSSVRVESRLMSGKYARQDADPRFRDYGGGVDAIVTSTGQEDSGLFETNLRDERYLPFEGTGAISEWHLRLPAKFRQFDYDSIADVVLHLRYTAREGGGLLRDQAMSELQQAANTLAHGDSQRGLFRMFSASREQPGEWHRFLHPAAGADQVLDIVVGKDRFPYLFADRKIRADKAQLILQLRSGPKPVGTGTFADAYAAGTPLRVSVTPPTGAASSPDLNNSAAVLGGMPTATVNVNVLVDGSVAWRITAAQADVAALPPVFRTPEGTLAPDVIEDLLLVVHYKLE